MKTLDRTLQRILVVGADGTIGRALAQALAARGDSVWTTTRRKGRAPGPSQIAADLAVDDLGAIPLPDVDVAVICAAMAHFADCREQPDLAYRINVSQPHALAQRLAAAGSRVVLLSTSAVFDCNSPRMRAEREYAPTSAYGTLKADAERRALAVGRATSVLRLTKVVARDMPLLRGWMERLRASQAVEAFGDLTIAPIATDHVVAALLSVLQDGAGGIYQVSGADDVSYADIARHLCRRLGADKELVHEISAVARGIPVSEVTRFTSLDTQRLADLSAFRAPRAMDVLDQVFGLTSR